jgi:periplasmic protein TonB
MKVPDFDDIIFERLNKKYGAYLLRKRYNRVVVLSIILAVSFATISVLIPFLSKPEQKSRDVYSSLLVTMENLKPPGPSGLLPDIPPPPSVPRLKSSVLKSIENAYVAPKVVDSIPPIEKPNEVKSDSIGLASGDIGDINGSDNGSVNGTGNYSGGVEGGTGGGGGDGIYATVDVMPTFKGGDINKFREWVQKKTKYPEEATINGIQGKVYITFIVETDGTVSTVKVAKGVDPLIDNEAVKAVKSSPKWSPGKLRGMTVRVSYIIMLDFQL